MEISGSQSRSSDFIGLGGVWAMKFLKAYTDGSDVPSGEPLTQLLC